MKNIKTYDVALIGLGPAGATFARLLSDKFSLIALDKKSNSEKSFRKPCGGLLAPDAQNFFAKFGLTLPTDILVNPQIFAVKTIDVKSKDVKYYQRFYLNLDRHQFDLWLKSLISEHITIENDVTCTNIKYDGTFYHITWKKEDEFFQCKSKYIVGADGANSIVRNTFYPDKKISSYIAIQQWFEDKHKKPFYSCIFDSSLTDCYAWGLSKNNKFIFGGAFPIKKGKENFEKLKEKMSLFDFVLENPIKTEACIVLRPSNPLQFCCGKNNMFLIGEAAGFISPSSLEGISYAFESAYILSKIFNSGKIKNEEYNRKTLSLKIKLTQKLLKNPFMYNEILRKFIMKSSFQSINVEK